MVAEGTSFLYLKKWRGNSGKKMAAALRETHNSLEKGRKVGLLMNVWKSNPESADKFSAKSYAEVVQSLGLAGSSDDMEI